MSLILAATDRSELAHTLNDELGDFGHRTRLVRTGRRVLDELGTDSFDIAVVDLLLPDIDGYEIARQIRLRSAIPIMMLVDSREDIGEAPHRVVSDCVMNPVDPRSLDLRITSVLRETASEELDKKERHGDLLIDRRSMSATMRGRPLVLTRTEWRVLQEMSANPGRLYSRDQLFRSVWGDDRKKTTVVDASIQNLRSKLEPDPAAPRYIKTVRGYGYRFGPLD